VAHGVLDQVGDHALEQGGIAGDRGGPKPGDHPPAGRVGGVAAVLQRLGGGVGQVGRLPQSGLPLAAGQREQPLEQPLAAAGGVADPFGHGAQLRLGGVGVGQGDVDFGAGDRQRGAQLVGGVGGKAALGVEGGVQAREHLVEGVGQLLELVVGAVQGDALVQGALRQALGGGGDALQRAQHLPGHHPAQPQRPQRHQPQDPQHRLQERPHRLGLDYLLERDDLRAGDLVAAARGNACGRQGSTLHARGPLVRSGSLTACMQWAGPGRPS
jgi:hypothetical protein